MRSSAGLFAAMTAFAAAAGCGPAAAPVTPVVAIAETPPPVAAPRKSLPTVTEPVENAPSEAQRLKGTWEDLETLSHHTIAIRGGQPTVTSIIDSDGSALEVQTVTWESGVLKWSYHVASTGYTVHLATERLEGDALWCTWSNSESSGSQEFRRVK